MIALLRLRHGEKGEQWNGPFCVTVRLFLPDFSPVFEELRSITEVSEFGIYATANFLRKALQIRTTVFPTAELGPTHKAGETIVS